MMRIFGTALLVGLVTVGTAAAAQSPVNVRQANQERRIDAGHRSGKLTHSEDARLKSEQRSIARLEKQLRARHGGHLTAADKRLIHARQESANRHILAQKQDGQRGRNKLKL
jgi:hypothetical protein